MGMKVLDKVGLERLVEKLRRKLPFGEGDSTESLIAAHNSLYRGKVLTDTYTLEDIYQMCADRDYRDIWVGDIIEVNMPAISQTGFAGGVTRFHVAEIEYSWKRSHKDPQSYMRGHLCLVPVDILGSAYMNSSNTTAGAWKGSYMYTTVMPAVTAAIEAAFGSAHVLTTSEFITTVVNTDNRAANIPNATGCVTFTDTWELTKATLMTELEAYGCAVFSSSGEDNRNSIGQMALFKANPRTRVPGLSGVGAAWWLRSVAHSATFCRVDGDASAHNGGASNVAGVRPRFNIG